ncbi:MAG: DUF2254 domain-containing protein [Actinomycetota bacterium]|nr:DUF2254 domain-containing protein [Actinomycetota bacterium]
MRLRLSALNERLRSSLFFVPMTAVLVAVVLGTLGLAVDSRIDQGGSNLPLGLTSTVQSARTLLSTIAGATITFAGIAFSISLLIIQLASSQYSPRVVHTLFRDPFNKRVMAMVVGTFTYCLIVLRSVRSALEQSGTPVIPNLSVAVAVVLGISTILAVVAFINHSAHAMDVSEIRERVRRESVEHARHEWALAEPGPRPADPLEAPVPPGCVIRFGRSGWVQQFDADALLRHVPEGGIMRLETYAGRYAIAGAPLCTLSPAPTDVEEATQKILAFVTVGDTRTMQHDPSYGLRQLADVALKALSPGINDPTTAQDSIFHSAAVLAEFLRRDPPPMRREGDDGRTLILPEQPTHDDLVRLTFDETRRAAAGQPTVCIYLIEAIDLVRETLASSGLPDRTGVLVEEAGLIVAGCEAAGLLPSDLALVRSAYSRRFGPAPPPATSTA